MREQWETIARAPNYAVSDYGRVVNLKTDRILRPALSNGYYSVHLRSAGQSLPIKVHRLVALAFVDGYRPGLVVNHIDGDKRNNSAWNLEWVRQQDNIRHAFNTGLSVSGRRTPIRVVETGEVFESQMACAEAIGGHQSSINDVLKGRARHHLGYTFEYVL